MQNGNGWLDLEDLANEPAINADHGPLDDLTRPEDTGGEASLHMTVKFRTEADNDVQGDVLTLVVTFTLNEDPSQ